MNSSAALITKRNLKKGRRREAGKRAIHIFLILLCMVGVAYFAWFSGWAKPIRQIDTHVEVQIARGK